MNDEYKVCMTQDKIYELSLKLVGNRVRKVLKHSIILHRKIDLVVHKREIHLGLPTYCLSGKELDIFVYRRSSYVSIFI